MRRSWAAPLGLLAPAMLVLVGLFVLPVGLLARYSFYRVAPGGIMVPAWVMENYTRFLLDPVHLRLLWTTARLALLVTALTLVLGYPLAYGLARTRSAKARALGVTVLLIPLMTSVVVRSYGWMVLLASSGLVNRLLLGLGLVDRPVQLLYTPRGVVIALAEVLLPFMVLSIMPVIQGIDESLEEASQSLGGGVLATFRHVLLPLSMPGVATGSLLVFVLSVGAFATPRLVGGPTTEVVTVFIYEQTMNLFNWPVGAATSLILLGLVLGATWIQGALLHRRRSPGLGT
jgi:putative spermidine/putrescine transport system permease protein